MPSAKRDHAAVRGFIEALASVFITTGVPRMPARVFSALLATDEGALTTSELGELLQVSPAAISGAVRYLTAQNLATREWEPGSRRERYRLHDDVWYEAIAKQEPTLGRWTQTLTEGIRVMGPRSPAGSRLAETLAFWEFMANEMPALLERWHAHRNRTLEAGRKKRA